MARVGKRGVEGGMEISFVLVFACQLCLCVFYNFLPCLCPCDVCTFNRRRLRSALSAYLLPFCTHPPTPTYHLPPPRRPLVAFNFFLDCSLQVSAVSLTCLRSTSLAWPKVAVAVCTLRSVGGGAWATIVTGASLQVNVTMNRHKHVLAAQNC